MSQIDHVVRIGYITAPADESGYAQRLQIKLNSYETNDITSFGLFGVASSPLPGTAAMVVNVSGNNSNGAVIATNDGRYRPTGMRGGEVCVYDSGGQKVYLSNSGGTLQITIKGGQQVNVSADTSISLTAPTVTINATTALNVTTPALNLTGTLSVSGNITGNSGGGAASIDLLNHRHTGVQAGSSTSGLPTG